MYNGIASWMVKLRKRLLSIQAFKGVEFGIGFEAAERRGSNVHDEIMYTQEEWL